MANSVITMGAVGQKIELGMLWDGHNYCTLAGLSLWDSKVVEQQQKVEKDAHTEFELQVTDEERRKAHKLDVEASLSATIGLFKLEGSAKYLNDKKSSQHEVVVTVTASVRTQSRRIPQEVLASIGYLSNLDLSQATHFVAEVVEGGSATMKFVSRATSSEDKQNIEGMLKASFKKVCLAIEGQAQVKLDDIEEEKFNSVSCKFAGDYNLEADISDFKGAMMEAAKFPKKLSGVCNTLTFKLLPLDMLDSKALRICRKLSDDLVVQTQNMIGKLDDVMLELDEVKRVSSTDSQVSLLEILPRQVVSFHTSFYQHKLKFNESVFTLLPQLKRGTEAEDQSLNELLSKAEQQCKTAMQFVKEKLEQFDVTRVYIKELLVSGFESKTRIPPRTQTMDREKPGFLFDLSIMDEKEVEHLFQGKLDAPKMKKRKAKRYRWWQDSNITSQMEEIRQFVQSNEFIGFQSENWLGLKPLENDEEEDEDDDGDVCVMFAHHVSKWVPWERIPEIENLKCTQKSAIDIRLEWEPCVGADFYVLTVFKYVSCAANDTEKVPFHKDSSGEVVPRLKCEDTSHVFINLEPGSSYSFKVTACSSLHGASVSSQELIVTTNTLPSIAQRMYAEAKKPGNKVGRIRQDKKLVLNCVVQFSRTISPGPVYDGEHECLRFVTVAPEFQANETFGEPEDALVIVLTGETGCGKSTQINAMVNYLYGVELEDDFRLIVVDDTGKSQIGSVTQYITVYQLRTFKGNKRCNRNVILVDSPGFGDSRGPKADEFITKAFAELFTEIPHLNSVALCQMSTMARLTDRGKAVITHMLQLFSKEISSNIIPVCTFADSGKPLCIEGLRQDNVPFKNYVKVQNALFASVDNVADDGQVRAQTEKETYWRLAVNGIKGLFEETENMPLRPLDPSKEVLKKRQKLQQTLHALTGALSKNAAHVMYIANQIDVLVTVLGTVPNETVAVKVPETVKLNLRQGTHVTLCMICNFTCHDDCGIPDDRDKAGCIAMSGGSCTMCQGKCHWKKHHNARYKYETRYHTEHVIPQDLINNWAGRNSSAEQAILLSINGDNGLKVTQKLVEEKMQEMVTIQGELQETALRHKPGVLSAYLNSLIESEKRRGADEGIISSLIAAKNSFDLSARGAQKQREERDKERVVNAITNELARRASLSKESRLAEEKKPSDFYNTIHDLLPRNMKQNKAIPKRLETSFMRMGNYPPFKESLQKTGQVLRFLIHS